MFISQSAKSFLLQACSKSTNEYGHSVLMFRFLKNGFEEKGFMKRIVSIGNWASYWNARNVHLRHERDVFFFKERQAVDLAWSKLGLGMLKFGVVAVGSVISVVLYFQEQAKARKQQDSARLLAFAKESRRIVETYSQMKEVVESVKQVETVLRANHVKWQIGRTDSAIGLYVPTLETEKSRYRVDDLEVILALSDPGKSATSPFFCLEPNDSTTAPAHGYCRIV